MDIVYLLKDAAVNEELTLSLRSLSHIPHDKVFFVGGFPVNINSELVYHIPTEQNGTKYQNATEGIKLASKEHDISENFILMNDDFFLMNDVTPDELSLHKGFVQDVLAEYHARPYKDESYVEGMELTKMFLAGIGKVNPLSFELHIPMVLNQHNLQAMFSMPGISAIPVFHWRTVYGNLYISNAKYTKDVKMDYYHPQLPESTQFLSTSDSYFQKVKPFLQCIFSEKSEYEL